ncbi:uncharacterized protein Aud_007825 [Aspergillus udagawae]|uniref:Uncharacterized protein n=1 Tax=Aspergillus udagawae TaxID=91492 RepID=A0A8E0QTV3_9EURO|nr:uncharacterized protein Aud_007825 [Aspergillus udagawae]GIC91382.1 hypothetical protein Aud_007825 [Aspergillus udagawae]
MGQSTSILLYGWRPRVGAGEEDVPPVGGEEDVLPVAGEEEAPCWWDAGGPEEGAGAEPEPADGRPKAQGSQRESQAEMWRQEDAPLGTHTHPAQCVPLVL